MRSLYLSTLWCAVIASVALAACSGDDHGDTSENATSQPAATRTKILPEGYSRAFSPRFNHAGDTIAMVAETDGGDEHIVLTDRAGLIKSVPITTGPNYLTTIAWGGNDETLYFSGEGGVLSLNLLDEDAEPKVVVDAFAVSGFDVAQSETFIVWAVNGQLNMYKDVLNDEGVQDPDTQPLAAKGSAPRISPDETDVLYIADGAFAFNSVGSFDLDTATKLDGEVSFLENGAWRSDTELLLLADDGIVSLNIKSMARTKVEDQFAALGLDVAQGSGDYVFHVNGGKALTLVELP